MGLPSQRSDDDGALVDEIIRSIDGADDPKRVRSLLNAWWRYAGVRAAAGAEVDAEKFLAERSALGLLELPVATSRAVIELEFAIANGPQGPLPVVVAPELTKPAERPIAVVPRAPEPEPEIVAEPVETAPEPPQAAEADEPVAAVESEVANEPAVEPEVADEPEAEPAEEPVAEAEPAVFAHAGPEAAPEPEIEPEPELEIEPVAEVEPAIAPEPEASPEPDFDDELEAAFAAGAAHEPQVEDELDWDPEPEAAHEPDVEPAPDVDADSAPDEELAPIPVAALLADHDLVDPPEEWEALDAPVPITQFERFRRDRADRTAEGAERAKLAVYAGLIVFFALAVGLAMAASLVITHVSLPGSDAVSIVAPWRAWLAIVTGVAGVVVATVIARRHGLQQVLFGPRIGLGGLAVTGIGLLAGSLIAAGAGGVVLLGGAALGAVRRA